MPVCRRRPPLNELLENAVKQLSKLHESNAEICESTELHIQCA